MSPVEVLIHDLFLLIINLAQLKDPARIIRTFIEGFNELGLGVTLSWVETAGEDHSQFEEISLRDASFGFLQLTGDTASLSPEMVSVIRNGACILAILLQNRHQAAQLTSSNERLEATVAQRTRELAERNESLRNEIQERKRMQEEREHLEAQLRQSQKMEAVGRLAGGVAHDFNNMLTAILGNVEYAMDRLRRNPASPDAGMLEAALGQIRQAGERSAALTRQLLAFSRKQMPSLQVLDPGEVITAMETMLRSMIGEQIELSIRTDASLHAVRIDKAQFEQVILNLVVNARDAMPNGGHLALEVGNAFVSKDDAEKRLTGEEGPHVVVSVSDTGNGIAPEHLEHLFEPFFTTKQVDKGTGLGLATVYGIVTQAGGHVTVDSEFGRGSVFSVCLPAVEPRDAEEPPPLPVDESRGAETVLLCEDETMVRQVIHAGLSSRGYHVIPAENGEDALHKASRHQGRLDLLITDLVMPRMNGQKLATELRKDRPDLRVLFMSGYAADVLDKRSVIDGCVDFIQKPFQVNELIQRVREILNNTGH